MKRVLSKLTKVDLREVWQHEALDFTNWLAKDENLQALSEEIGVDIKLIKTEASVGKFNVDILANEETTERKIIIENQLEETNHDHLGKIITYTSGYDAEIIIWIVKKVREEHKKAIEWLNEHTDENINFFLIKIELWQIGNSDPAPKFDIIVSPNEWAKVIKTNAKNGGVTETKLQQLEFWKRFKDYVEQRDNNINLQTPRPQHYYNFTIGSSEAHIGLTVNTKKRFISCELWINNNKNFFEFIKNNKQDIENKIGQKCDWWVARKATGVRIIKDVDGLFNWENSEENFEWLYKNVLIFKQVFTKYLRGFKK